MKKFPIFSIGMVAGLLLILTGCQQTAAPVSGGQTADIKTGPQAVTITKSGFQPGILTTKAGTKVIFQNTDEDPHWPASDPHPIHSITPGFDAKHGLAKGETYEFTFTEVKSYPFHDHLNPALRGSINIIE